MFGQSHIILQWWHVLFSLAAIQIWQPTFHWRGNMFLQMSHGLTMSDDVISNPRINLTLICVYYRSNCPKLVTKTSLNGTYIFSNSKDLHVMASSIFFKIGWAQLMYNLLSKYGNCNHYRKEVIMFYQNHTMLYW